MDLLTAYLVGQFGVTILGLLGQWMILRDIFGKKVG